MLKRFDTGTDVAMIGAWDVTRTEPIQKFSDLLPSLSADANDGHLFLVWTDSDGGWLVELRLDEPAPDPTQYIAVARETLLRAPSGRLKVGGVEDYRSSRPPQITSELDVVEVPPGDYAVRFHFKRYTEDRETEDSAAEVATDKELLRVVTADDLRFTRHRQLTGCLLIVLGLFAAVIAGWQYSVNAGVLIALATVFGIGGTMMKRFDTDARVMRVEEASRAIGLRKSADRPADWILALRPLRSGELLTGGAISLSEEEKATETS